MEDAQGGNEFPRRISTAPAAPGTSAAAPGGVGTNVRVVARIRPLSPRELGEGGGGPAAAISAPTPASVLVSGGGGGDREGRTFDFDAVFNEGSTQEEVYGRSCGDMVGGSIYRGFNATILAYGQTGSGKVRRKSKRGSGEKGERRLLLSFLFPPTELHSFSIPFAILFVLLIFAHFSLTRRTRWVRTEMATASSPERSATSSSTRKN